MSHFTYIDGRGDGHYHLRMFVYPNTANTNWECRYPIPDALEYHGDRLINGGAIDEYSIYKYNGYTELPAGNSSEHLSEFERWLDRKGYDNYVGAHLGVTNMYGGGLAGPNDSDGSTAFATGAASVMGTDTSTTYYKLTAIHEVSHTAIHSNLDIVESMLDNNGDEHELGRIYGDDDASPMCAVYGNAVSTEGTCSSNRRHDGYSLWRTSCTNEAIKHTAQHER